MKVLIVSAADVGGGAFIAARRLHKALLNQGVESRMLVAKKTLDEITIIGPSSNTSHTWADIRHYMPLPLHLLHKTDNPNLHSFNIVPSSWHKIINDMDIDVVNLHWVNREMMSIADIGKINKPIVWTLHDMWPLLGTAHYEKFHDDHAADMPEKGFVDLDKWMYSRKASRWSHLNMAFVAPSRWMAGNVAHSRLFSQSRVANIVNPVDMSVYRPYSKQVVREILGLKPEKFYLLFGAMTGASDIRKGFSYLKEALYKLSPERYSDVELLILGGGSGTAAGIGDLPFKKHMLGRMHDDVALSMVYNAADVYVTPSLADNLPNTVAESLCCGTPVVAFAGVGGIGDMIINGNGYLAALRDPVSLAEGIQWALAHSKDEAFRTNIRKTAESLFAETKVADEYRQFYHSVLQQAKTA